MIGQRAGPGDHGQPLAPLPGGRAPRPEHVPPEQTTLPTYLRPELGPAPHLVVSVGERASRTARDLMRAGDRLCTITDVDGPSAVAAELARLTTGWRILVVGPERDVLTVRSAALAAGALDVEITLVPTDVRRDDDGDATRVRLLFCGACHRRFDACAAVRDHVACPGCRAVLTVAAHHSRRLGAFLGVPVGRRA